MEEYISDEDLWEILSELDETENEKETILEIDSEILASKRRYEEIIKKYK